MLLVCILIWIVCSVFSYGIAFAHFQKEYPTVAEMTYHSDKTWSIVFSVFGPISLVMAYFLSGGARHGLKFK